MTKNKRFMIKKDGFKKYTVSDKLNQFALPITNKTSCEAIAFALNSLWEQTQRFEKHNQELIQENIKYEEEIDELKNENEQLKQALRDSYINEICENCKYGNYFLSDNFDGGFEGDFECLKKHFGNDHWECDGLTECDEFELEIKGEIDD